jgi:hypothetical protein
MALYQLHDYVALNKVRLSVINWEKIFYGFGNQ